MEKKKGEKNREEREGFTLSLPSPRNFFTLSPNREPYHRLPSLQCSALFASRQSPVELLTFQSNDANVRTSQELDFRLITTSKNDH